MNTINTRLSIRKSFCALFFLFSTVSASEVKSVEQFKVQSVSFLDGNCNHISVLFDSLKTFVVGGEFNKDEIKENVQNLLTFNVESVNKQTKYVYDNYISVQPKFMILKGYCKKSFACMPSAIRKSLSFVVNYFNHSLMERKTLNNITIGEYALFIATIYFVSLILSKFLFVLNIFAYLSNIYFYYVFILLGACVFLQKK